MISLEEEEDQGFELKTNLLGPSLHQVHNSLLYEIPFQVKPQSEYLGIQVVSGICLDTD